MIHPFRFLKRTSNTPVETLLAWTADVLLSLQLNRAGMFAVVRDFPGNEAFPSTYAHALAMLAWLQPNRRPASLISAGPSDELLAMSMSVSELSVIFWLLTWLLPRSASAIEPLAMSMSVSELSVIFWLLTWLLPRSASAIEPLAMSALAREPSCSSAPPSDSSGALPLLTALARRSILRTSPFLIFAHGGGPRLRCVPPSPVHRLEEWEQSVPTSGAGTSDVRLHCLL